MQAAEAFSAGRVEGIDIKDPVDILRACHWLRVQGTF
jgi:hypothetical protein